MGGRTTKSSLSTGETIVNQAVKEVETKAKSKPAKSTSTSVNLNQFSFGTDSTKKSIQTKLDKAPVGTILEYNNNLSFRKKANGRWARIDTQTGYPKGNQTHSSYDLSDAFFRKIRGYTGSKGFL